MRTFEATLFFGSPLDRFSLSIDGVLISYKISEVSYWEKFNPLGPYGSKMTHEKKIIERVPTPSYDDVWVQIHLDETKIGPYLRN